MRTAILVFILLCLPLASCKSSKRPAADEDEPREESALQEYVNEPKRQANSVKGNLEAAQEKEAEQARELAED